MGLSDAIHWWVMVERSRSDAKGPHESFLPWKLLINYSEMLCAVSGPSLTSYDRFWIKMGGEAAVHHPGASG